MSVLLCVPESCETRIYFSLFCVRYFICIVFMDDMSEIVFWCHCMFHRSVYVLVLLYVLQCICTGVALCSTVLFVYCFNCMCYSVLFVYWCEHVFYIIEHFFIDSF